MKKNNLKDKWVICLGGSASKIPIIEAVKKRGLNCCVIDRNPNCVAKNFSDLFLNISTFNSDDILEQLIKLNIKDNIFIIFAYTSLMQAQYSALRIAKDLNILGWSESTLKLAWDKISFKNLCGKIGILTPESIIPNDIDEIKYFIKEKGLVVYKPKRGGVGSEKVHLINSSTNLNSINYKNNSFFLEEFMGNNLYSLDGLIIDHKIVFKLITRKYVRTDSQAIAGFSSYVDKEIKNAVNILIGKLIRAIDLNNTFFSFDIILNNELFYFIDFGILLDCEIDRFLNYMGIDVFGLFIDYFLSRKNILKIIFNDKIAMAFLYPLKKGKIKKLPKLGDIYSFKTDLAVEFNKKIYDKCNKRGLVEDKIGHIIKKNICWKDIRKMASLFEKNIIID